MPSSVTQACALPVLSLSLSLSLTLRLGPPVVAGAAVLAPVPHVVGPADAELLGRVGRLEDCVAGHGKAEGTGVVRA